MIARAALSAIDPRALVSRALGGAAGATIGAYRSHFVCAVGKAADGMLDAFRETRAVAIRGVVHATRPHPVPTPESCDHARRALDLAADVDDRACLVLLVSGGASAMLALPAPGLTLDDKIAASKVMLARGMPIEEMNAVRKHLSGVKGGRLAAAARACCTLAISDVIGPAEDDLSVIGSGPGVADASTFAGAVQALKDRGVWETLPERARDHLSRGERGQEAETPKPGDPTMAKAAGFVIGSRRDAMEGARKAAEARGFRTVVIDEPTLGEARVAGPALIARALQLAGESARICVISSGETTVHVTGNGRGGRNQELALSALPLLAASARAMVLASVGTDGVDGPTDAAGAVVDSRSLSRALASGLSTVDAVLAANDSYPFLDAIGDLVRTGPTGTNVGDLQIILLGS